MTRGARPPRAERALVLFGAFDRHNFGDLLLAHCAAARHRDRAPVFAGLASRDLTAFGGHRVEALADVVGRLGDAEVDVVHVGGEVLTTTAWEAAVMLQPAGAAALAIATHGRGAASRDAWAARMLGTSRRIPYVVGRAALPRRWHVQFEAVGGAAFAALERDARSEVLDALHSASAASVRDARTRDALDAHGIRAALVPDPAARTPALLGEVIAARARSGEVAELAARFGRWVAVQLAAERGDDDTLDRVARSLLAHVPPDVAIVLFCAGLAPWHDDRATLDRLARRLEGRRVAVLASAHVFDLCALLARSRAYVGTSLHGWIVADSFGVPAHCLVGSATDKAAAYIDTWKPGTRLWRTLDDADLLPGPRTLSG